MHIAKLDPQQLDNQYARTLSTWRGLQQQYIPKLAPNRRSTRVLFPRPRLQGDGREGDGPAKARPTEVQEGEGATPERPSTPESSGVGTVPCRPRRGVAAADNGGGDGDGGSSGENKSRKRGGGGQERVSLSMQVRVCRGEWARQ